MRRAVAGLVLVLGASFAAACSSNTVTGGTGVGVLDPAAKRACADLQVVLQLRRSGASPAQLRERISVMYDDARQSGNAVMQARAVALFADATVLATGGEPGSLDADLAAMNAECTGHGA
jgi:hypothetical protein